MEGVVQRSSRTLVPGSVQKACVDVAHVLVLGVSGYQLDPVSLEVFSNLNGSMSLQSTYTQHPKLIGSLYFLSKRLKTSKIIP